MKILRTGIATAAVVIATVSTSANALSVSAVGSFGNPTSSDFWFYRNTLDQDNTPAPGIESTPTTNGAESDSVAYFGWGIDAEETIDGCTAGSCEIISSHFWFNGTGSIGGDPAATPVLGEMFSLGTFTYNNQETILSGGIVDIDFSLSISIDNTVTIDPDIYTIRINNTWNGLVDSTDTATLLDPQPGDMNFFLGGIEYQLHLNGFIRDFGIGPETQAILAEGDTTQAEIYATITQITPVPVPAAAWLMLSGLLGLVGVARKR